jgi:hypothetical protein
VAGVASCPRCGAALSSAPPQSSPQSPSPPGNPPEYPAVGPPGAPSARIRAKRKLVGSIVAIIVVLVVLIIVLLLYAGATTVQVTSLHISSSDNVCGANGNTLPGFSLHGGGSVQETLNVYNSNDSRTCTILTVRATTAGFGLSGANTPVTIPAGQVGELVFTVTAPNSAYVGALTIDLE